MGKGRTNAGVGGGGGSTFSATLQVATDANAVITAVNLAGDTFSGTANSSGVLTLTITEPGTYTVTETNGAVESIVIADNGETYQLSIIAFDGYLITDATVVVDGGFQAVGYAYQQYSSFVPYVYTTTFDNVNVINISKGSSTGTVSGMYRTAEYIDLTPFNTITLYGNGNYATMSGSPIVWGDVVALSEDNTLVTIGNINHIDGGTNRTYNFSVSNLTGNYKVGILLYGDVNANVFIRNLYLH